MGVSRQTNPLEIKPGPLVVSLVQIVCFWFNRFGTRVSSLQESPSRIPLELVRRNRYKLCSMHSLFFGRYMRLASFHWVVG